MPRLCKEEIKAEFELCWDQSKDVPSTSTERCQECKLALSGMAYKYANLSIDKIRFPWDKDHVAALKGLKRNKELVISRPDKGCGDGQAGLC